MTRHPIAYLGPVLPEEELLVQSRLTGFDHKRIWLEGVMKNKGGNEVKSVLWTRFNAVHLSGKPASHPEDVLEFLGRIQFKDPAADFRDFERRVAQIRFGA